MESEKTLIMRHAWQAASLQEGLPLAQDEVHLWRVWLDTPPVPQQHLMAVLAPEERDRAQRYHLERDRQRSVVSRGMLRYLLASYEHTEPADIALGTSLHGKPTLAASAAVGALHFNVSHSEDLVVYAIARNGPLGVDVERLREVPDALDIARRFFAPGEQQALARIAPARRSEAFLRCWCQKEAYLKALGCGLLQPLDTFEVAIDPGFESRPRMGANPDVDSDWRLYMLEPAPGYVTALAVRTRRARLVWCAAEPSKSTGDPK